MNEDQIRLECLRLAVACGAGDVINTAKAYTAFVSPHASSKHHQDSEAS
jgi:hypothetical protein